MNTPAATAEPMTPATFGPMACISRKLPGFSRCASFWETRAAIGTAEIIHAATRGENLTVIFVNNGIYGMTGGQMAPTTLIGQNSVTCPGGRDPDYHGKPIRMCEMLAQLDGVCYAERVTIDTPAHIRATKKAIKKGIQNQIDRKGFSIIEVISPCPVQWGLAPCDAYRRIEREVEPFYGLKVFKDIDAEVQA